MRKSVSARTPIVSVSKCRH